MSTHKHSSDPNRPYSVPSVSALRLGSVIPSEIPRPFQPAFLALTPTLAGT
jgi:hypothetical protein